MSEDIVRPITSTSTSVVQKGPTPETTPTPTANVSPPPEVPEKVEDPEDAKADWQALETNYLTSPVFYEVANYFGIEQADYATAKDRLSDIVDYVVKSKKSPHVEDILLGLRELEDKVQPPAWGEKRYANLYRYIRLAGKRLALEQAMGAFEKK